MYNTAKPPTGKYAVGVDLGGTKTEAILLDENYNILKRIRTKTPSHDYNKIVSTITSLIAEVAPNPSKVEKIGVCTPGTAYIHADGDKEVIRNSNTQSLQNMPLHHDLQRRLNTKIVMENDANCFALAEAVLGAGAGFQTVFGVIMGTGVGGGIVIDGRIHRGRTGISGEWGHHTLHIEGNHCYCGRRGCVETYISGPALEHRWEELTGQRCSMQEILSGRESLFYENNDEVSDDGRSSKSSDCRGSDNDNDGRSSDCRGRSNDGRGRSNDNINKSSIDPAGQYSIEPPGTPDNARIWRDEWFENLGYGLANVVDILDPDAIVLGGGLSNIGMLYDLGIKSVREKIFSDMASDIPILRNRLGDSAGVIGACLL